MAPARHPVNRQLTQGLRTIPGDRDGVGHAVGPSGRSARSFLPARTRVRALHAGSSSESSPPVPFPRRPHQRGTSDRGSRLAAHHVDGSLAASFRRNLVSLSAATRTRRLHVRVCRGGIGGLLGPSTDHNSRCTNRHKYPKGTARPRTRPRKSRSAAVSTEGRHSAGCRARTVRFGRRELLVSAARRPCGRLHARLTDPLQSDMLHQQPSSPGL
jgi:hypothetical protein